jgi:hypothetical protein
MTWSCAKEVLGSKQGGHFQTKRASTPSLEGNERTDGVHTRVAEGGRGSNKITTTTTTMILTSLGGHWSSDNHPNF